MREQVESYNNESGGRYRRLRPGPGLSREKVAADQQSRLRRAVIEIVATDGYDALRVRGLTRRAQISSGALYDHFSSTDDCFLSTFDLICERVAARMREASGSEREPRRRLTLAVERLFEDIAAAPQTAAFMLRAAPAAGPGFTSRLWDSATQIGTALQACFDAGDPAPPPSLLDGLVGGLARIGRTQITPVGESDACDPASEAVEWIMSLCIPGAADADPLPALAPAVQAGGRSDGTGLENYRWGAPGDDRAMILAATFRIARGGHHQLSVPRICREAGVPRRAFNRYFEGVEECFSSALEERVVRAAAAWLRKGSGSATWSEAVCDALQALCQAVEDDVEGARVLFTETSAAGTDGIDSCDRQISQIARILRSPAPDADRPTVLAAEASTAGAWTLLGRRILKQSNPWTADLLQPLSFLVLAPAMSGPASLRRLRQRLRGLTRNQNRCVSVLDSPLSE